MNYSRGNQLYDGKYLYIEYDLLNQIVIIFKTSRTCRKYLTEIKPRNYGRYEPEYVGPMLSLYFWAVTLGLF